MRTYEMMVDTYDAGTIRILESWSGSELFEAETQLGALREAVRSLADEHKGRKERKNVTWFIDADELRGGVRWDINDFRFVDVVTMIERK